MWPGYDHKQPTHSPGRHSELLSASRPVRTEPRVWSWTWSSLRTASPSWCTMTRWSAPPMARDHSDTWKCLSYSGWMRQLNTDSGETESHSYNCTCGPADAEKSLSSLIVDFYCICGFGDTWVKLLCSSSTGRNLPERKSQLWRKLWRNASGCNSPSTLTSKVTLMRCCQQTTNCYVKYSRGRRLQIVLISNLMTYNCAVVAFFRAVYPHIPLWPVKGALIIQSVNLYKWYWWSPHCSTWGMRQQMNIFSSQLTVLGFWCQTQQHKQVATVIGCLIGVRHSVLEQCFQTVKGSAVSIFLLSGSCSA